MSGRGLTRNLRHEIGDEKKLYLAQNKLFEKSIEQRDFGKLKNIYIFLYVDIIATSI